MSTSSDWYGNWLRTGHLPDGRQAFAIHLGVEAVHACFDVGVLDRANKRLPVPDPDEGPAPDGYVTPWERV